MRRLLAILLVVGTPAWAANDEKPDPKMETDIWQAEIDLCRQMGVAYKVCVMRHALNEHMALYLAKQFIQQCEGLQDDPTCAETRAYIKQRWGY